MEGFRAVGCELVDPDGNVVAKCVSVPDETTHEVAEAEDVAESLASLLNLGIHSAIFADSLDSEGKLVTRDGAA